MMENLRQKACSLLRKNSGTLLAACAALFTALVIFSGGVRASAGDDALRVSVPLVSGVTVRYDDIRAARLVENVDPGSRLSGMRGARVLAGRYLNGEFGGYALYAYADVPLAIDLLTEDGHVLLNQADEDATRALYEQLLVNLPDIP